MLIQSSIMILISYNAGDKAETLDLFKDKEFLGWSLLEEAEEPDYLLYFPCH